MKAHRKTLNLDKGLQPDGAMVMNSAWLRQVKGLYRGLAGLELEPVMTAQWNATSTWPFPQVLNLRRELLLGNKNSLQLVNADWSLTTLLTGLTDATFWQVIDFGTVYYIASGAQVFIRDIAENTTVEVAYANFPKLKTFCKFRGQLVGGNAVTNWQTDVDEHFAVWSGIGRTDFIPDWKNEAGWMDMEIGDIYLCGNFQDTLVLYYGEEGIAALVPAQNTFGYQRVSHQGLLGPFSVGFGDGHLALLEDGTLWLFTNEGFSQLGYREQMAQLTADDVRISWNPLHRAFYISDGTKTYLFANNHLTESNLRPTSIALLSGTLYAPTKVNTSIEVILESSWQDLNLVGLKAVEFLELGLACDGTVQATSRVNYQLGEMEVLGAWKPVNDSGFCYISAAGNKFTVLVKLLTGTIFRLDYITYGVKLSDNRIQNQLQTISDRSWHVS